MAGTTWHISSGGSIDLGLGTMYYTGSNDRYVAYFELAGNETNLKGRRMISQQNAESLRRDIRNGADSPWLIDFANGVPAQANSRTQAINMAQRWMGIYNNIHYFSYPDS